MRKIILLVLLVAVFFTACQNNEVNTEEEIDTTSSQSEENKEEVEVNTQVANPMKEMESPEDFKPMGLYIIAPDNSSDIKYSAIVDIAQAIFVYEDMEYYLRAAKTADDISGLYYDNFEEKTIKVSIDNVEVDVLVRKIDMDYKITDATFFINDVQFNLSTQNLKSDEEISSLVSTIYNSVKDFYN